MTKQVEDLFHELVDLARAERLEYYSGHDIDAALQAEVEGLLLFDQAGDQAGDDSLGDAISAAARRVVGDAGLASGSRCGPYRLLERLGQGGMGAVYRAERADGEITQEVAIKTLHPGLSQSVLRERFLRERELLGHLNHPCIARLLDAGHAGDGQPYLVMEYVDGHPIDQFASGKSIEEQIGLVVEVCEAVTHAHRHLIIHRDLKPSNILVEKSGRPKLLDFGIAKLLDDTGGNTETADRMLTPAYASPEQIRGESQTTATDVYSLGAILYKLLTGRSPHESDTNRQMAVEIAAGVTGVITARRLNANVPADLDHIVRQALRREPEERYSSVEALSDDLRRFLSHKPIRARPESLLYESAKFVRRNRMAVALAAIAVAATLAGVTTTLLQARAARIQRDFAIRQLARAEETGDLNSFLLSDVAPRGKPFLVKDLLAEAERMAERQTGDEANLARMLTSIGSQYLSLDEEAKSREILERAYRLSRSVPDPSIRSRAACALAKALPGSRDAGRSDALAREGLAELTSDAVYAHDRAYCLQCAAAVLRHNGQGEEATATIQRALEALKLAPFESRTQRASLALDLAESYRIAGKLGDAVVASEEAAGLLAALGRGETQRAGTLFNNWALTLNLLGRQLEAEKIYRRAMEIGGSDARGRGVSPMLLLNYGRVLADLARYREAEGYVQRAYDEAKRGGSDVVVAQSLIVKASLCRALKQTNLADRAIDEFDSMIGRVFPPGHAVSASLMSQRSLNAQARGDSARALDLANQAASLTESLVREGRGGRDLLAIVLQRRADTQLLLGRLEESVSDARRTLEILGQQGQSGSYSSDVGLTRLSLGRALWQQADHEQARGMFRSAGEHLRMTLGAEHPKTLEAVRLSRQ